MNPYVNTIQPPQATPGGVADDVVAILQQIANGAGGGSGSIAVNGVSQNYDYQAFTYKGSTASNDALVETVTYKSGGASGTVVAVTRTAYFGSSNNKSSVTTTAF